MAYKKAYHNAINDLYNMEFYSTSDVRDRDERIQSSIKHLFQVIRMLIDGKKQGANNSKSSHTKDLLDILISEKDPETGKKFDYEKVQFQIRSRFIFFFFVILKNR
jgi:hypothetical protein